MMHKHPRSSILAVVTAALLVACTPSDNKKTEAGPSGAPPAAAGGAAAAAAPSLGSVSFQRDESIQPAVATIVRNQEARLEVIDAQGSQWTLTIPAGSVPSGTKVSVVSLTHLSSTDLPAPPVAGVLLEPDGLVLLRPATLSVALPGPGKATQLLTGRHDGTGMTFALPAKASAGPAALLSHFSTEVAVSVATPEQKAAMRTAALTQRAELLETIRTLLKQDVGSMPTPPSLELECNDEIIDLLNQELVDHFVREAGDPEMDLTDQWNRVNQSLSDNGADPDSEYFDVVRQLDSRLLKKAERLLKEYKGQRDKALAVAGFYAKLARLFATHFGETGEIDSALNRLGDWLAELLEPMLNDLIDKHDYRQVTPIIRLAQEIGAAGGTSRADWEQQRNDLVDRLSAAFEFRLETEFKLHLPRQEWLVKATIPIRKQWTQNDWMLIGEGTGKAQSYTGSASVPMKAHFFSVIAFVDDFDACAGTAKVRISMQGSGASETYVIDEQELRAALPIVENSWKAMFSEQANGDGFPCKVRNFDATAIEETISGTTPHGQVSGDLTLRLVHVPKRMRAPRAYSSSK